MSTWPNMHVTIPAKIITNGIIMSLISMKMRIRLHTSNHDPNAMPVCGPSTTSELIDKLVTVTQVNCPSQRSIVSF